MSAFSPLEPGAHDVRLLKALRALDDPALDRARAHLAAGLPVRRADLGWRGAGPAREGCVVGVSMSRRQFAMRPLRVPGLLLLAAIFDSWAFEEELRVGGLAAARGRRLGQRATTRLAELLDLEWRRRSGWEAPGSPQPGGEARTAVKIAW